MLEEQGDVRIMNQLREWDGNCQRCRAPSQVHTMSIFDVALICMDCADREQEHNKYLDAQRAEREAIKRGDMNFPGIGYEEPDNEG